MEITYGFVDENNILINTAVVNENDTEILETIKEAYNVTNAYPVDLDKITVYVGKTYWGGTRFLNPPLYPSMVWNEEINAWETPVPCPIEAIPGHYWSWDESIVNWVSLEAEPFVEPEE
jgi:hypothetical protein